MSGLRQQSSSDTSGKTTCPCPFFPLNALCPSSLELFAGLAALLFFTHFFTFLFILKNILSYQQIAVYQHFTILIYKACSISRAEVCGSYGCENSFNQWMNPGMCLAVMDIADGSLKQVEERLNVCI